MLRHPRRAEPFDRARMNVRDDAERAPRPLVVVRAARAALRREESQDAAGALLAKLHQGEQPIDAGKLATVDRSRHELGRRGDLTDEARTPALVLVPGPPAAGQAFVAGAQHVRPWGRLRAVKVESKTQNGASVPRSTNPFRPLRFPFSVRVAPRLAALTSRPVAFGSMAFKLPTRRSTAQALPAGGYRAASGVITTQTQQTPSRYADAGRKVFGAIRGGARRAASGIQTKGNAMAGALARAQQTDTLGGVFAQMATPMVAAGVNGMIDGSDVGQRFTDWTGGWIQPSTALMLLGGVLRGFGVDRKYLGKHLTRANSANLKAMLPVKLYQFGFRVPGLVSSRMAERNQRQLGPAPGVAGVEGAQSSQAAPPPPAEHVPGEAASAI